MDSKITIELTDAQQKELIGMVLRQMNWAKRNGKPSEFLAKLLQALLGA